MKNKTKSLPSVEFAALLAGLACSGATAQSDKRPESINPPNQPAKAEKDGKVTGGARDGDQSSARKDERPERSRAQHRER